MEARDDELIPWDAQFDDPNDPLCISALDVANAFNTLYRSAIHAGVLEYCPNIISLYRWSYGPTAILCLSDGLPICTSESGIRQGDPLGPLLYCVGVHSTLQDVKIKEPKATIVAFIDDDNIIGLRSKLLNALSIFQTKLAAIGQICNLPKCLLLDPSQHAKPVPALTCPIPVSLIGLKLLGGPLGQSISWPLGSDSFVSSFLTKHIGLKAKILPYLDKLPADIAFNLLRTCINNRPMYLTRILAPWLTESMAISFDSLVDKSLSVITGYQSDLPPLAQAVRSLPLHLGGASVRRLQDSRECAYSASFLAASPHIRSCHSWILAPEDGDQHRVQSSPTTAIQSNDPFLPRLLRRHGSYHFSPAEPYRRGNNSCPGSWYLRQRQREGQSRSKKAPTASLFRRQFQRLLRSHQFQSRIF